MATDLELLLVRVEANLKQYEKEMARARQIGVKELRAVEAEGTKAANRLERSFAGVGTKVKSSMKGFAAGIIAGLGVEQIARAAATAIKSIADIGDQATKLGLTTDEFQTMGVAAELAGTTIEAFASSMKKLGVNSSDAVRGQGEFGDILKANNVSLTDANGQMRSQIEILGIVADLVKNAANEQDQLAIAQAAMGKSGSEMMGLLVQGSAAVTSAYAQASNEVGRFSAEQIARMQEIDDQIDILTKNISFGIKDAFASAAIGAVDFANISIDALDAVGVKAASIGEGILTVYRNIPGFGPLVQFGEAAMARGRSKVAADALAKRNIARPAPELFAPGKGDLPNATPTVIPSKPDTERSIPRRVSQTKALVTVNKELEASQRAQEENARLNADAEAELIQIRIDAAQLANQNALDLIQAQRQGFVELAELGFSALERIAMGGEKAKDVILDLAKSLAQAALQAALFGQGPLASFLGGASGGGIFGSLASGLFGGGVPASIYHDGGVVGRGGPMRNVSPALFAGAQRYHSGGIAGLKSGEVPAILQRGEIVIPRGGKMSGGPSQAKITVNVNGATGNAEVQRMVQAGISAGLSQYARGEQERAVERQARG